MKSTGHLIKTQQDTDSGRMADIAAEVAAEAVARSQYIQQETQKLSKKMESRPKQDDEVSLHGGVLQDPKADIQDIRKRSIHQIDLSDRLPWLKDMSSTKSHHGIVEEHEDDEIAHRDHERLTSPDSGVIDHLSEATESFDSHMSIHLVSSPPHLELKQQLNTEDNDVLLPPPNLEDHHFQDLLHNGEMAAALEPLSSDYPILPPPKDYPTLEQCPDSLTATDVAGPHFDSNPAGDVYTVQEAKANSSYSTSKKFKLGSTTGVHSASQLCSQKVGSQLDSKSTSNLLNVR